MAKFVFRLQSLLDLKEQMEESFKNELGRAMGKLESERLKLIKLENEREECIELFNTSSDIGAAVGKLKTLSAFLLLLGDRMNRQKENINYAQNVVDRYREQLVKVSQEKEMLGKLRDTKHQEFFRQQLKDEQKVNDEIFSYKYVNRMTGDANGSTGE